MKKYLWTSENIVKATHANLMGPLHWKATLPSIDTRSLTKGQLYIAIKGERLDGHDYILEAFKKGAIAVVSEKKPAELSDTRAHHAYAVVPDTLSALIQMGHFARAQLKGTVIAVTGSAGKTTTKDLLHLCLSAQGSCHASQKSFNTKWGVPLTLAECDPSLDYVVLEMGMSSAGEIRGLTQVGKPHIAIITTIAAAHLEFFKSIDGIARAKAEIFEGMNEDGVAVLNRDIPQYELLASLAKKAGLKKIMTFGRHAEADYRLVSYTPTPTGSMVEALIEGELYTYPLTAYGEHMALNTVSVLGCVKLAKGDVKKAVKAFDHFQPSDRRGNTYALKDNITVIDESYNANPLSMTVALKAFAERKFPGRKIMVLGDMRELGPDAPRFHEELAPTIRDIQPDRVYLIGPHMAFLSPVLSPVLSCHHFTDIDAMQKIILDDLMKNDTIIVKSSKSMMTDKIVEKIVNKFK